MRQVIESAIQERGLSKNVVMLDSVACKCILGFYAAADLFVLAAMHDPCLLSVMKVLHAGLPLLLSRRLGDASDALEEGGNGWSFNPLDSRNSRDAAAKAFGSGLETLRQMGDCPAELAARRWQSVDVVDRLLDEILRLRAG